LSNMLPAVAPASKAERMSETIASALNDIADRFSSRAHGISRGAGRMSEQWTADAMHLGDDALRKVAREVEQRPLVTLAIAVGVGALAAGVFGRREGGAALRGERRKPALRLGLFVACAPRQERRVGTSPRISSALCAVGQR